MSTFFQQTAQAMIAKHIDRFPLLKLDQVIDWQPIEHYLNRQRTRYLRDHRGRPAYPLLSMFKAVLPGQWHSLSDPRTRTQPHRPHRFQPVLPFRRTDHPRLQYLMPLPQLAGARRHPVRITQTD
ncbi:putative transposase [Neisseria meningitidis 61103]|nr:putative transposase [Neisseria meningitidis 61103]